MKRTNLHFICALMAVLAIIAFDSCNQEELAETTLTINIDSSVSRGIEAMPMDTVRYHAYVVDTAGNCVFDKTVSSSTLSISAQLVPGPYTIVVDALN